MASTVYRQLLPTFNDVEPHVQVALQRSKELLKVKMDGLKSSEVASKAAAGRTPTAASTQPAFEVRDYPETD